MIEGIFIGVIGSGVTYFLGRMFTEWLWPKYRAAVYKGGSVSGEWEVYYEGVEGDAATLWFDQKGMTITGQSSVSKDKDGNKVDRRYKYTGSFLDNSIVLTFEDEFNPGAMGGAMVFYNADSDGFSMRGKSIYFKPEENDVAITNAILKRKYVS